MNRTALFQSNQIHLSNISLNMQIAICPPHCVTIKMTKFKNRHAILDAMKIMVHINSLIFNL